MTIFSQGPNPAHQTTPWSQALSPLAQSAGAALGRQNQQKQNIAQQSILQTVLDEIVQQRQRGQEPNFENILRAFSTGEQQGLSPQYRQQYLENAPKFMEQEAKARQQQNALEKPDVAAQKWAYEQLNAEPLIRKSNEALDKIEQLVKKNVTGPIKGRLPNWLSDEESRKIRSAIDAESLNVVGTHSALFRNGSFTDREFNFIKDKTLNSKMSPGEMMEVAKIYREMNDLALRRFNAVREAVKSGGFTPDLPLRVGEMEKEASDLKKKLLDTVGYNGASESTPPKFPGTGQGEGGGLPGAPEVLGRTQQVKVRHKKSGREASIPRSEFHPHPDYELLDTGNQ